jgi:hypothetical protein
VNLGEVERRTLGMPDLSMATAMHPIGGLRVDAVQAKVETLLEQVVRGVTGQ